MNFKEGCELEIGGHVGRKGKFFFLSWSRAVEHLRVNFPEATWIVHEVDNAPFRHTELGYFVKVSVFIDNHQYTQVHPVLDNKNKPIEKPTSFQINTSIQRCLVKAIGLATGIGIKLYSGEDLPVEGDNDTITDDQQTNILAALETAGMSEDDFLKMSKIKSIDQLNVNRFDGALAYLKTRKVEK